MAPDGRNGVISAVQVPVKTGVFIQTPFPMPSGIKRQPGPASVKLFGNRSPIRAVKDSGNLSGGEYIPLRTTVLPAGRRLRPPPGGVVGEAHKLIVILAVFAQTTDRNAHTVFQIAVQFGLWAVVFLKVS